MLQKKQLRSQSSACFSPVFSERLALIICCRTLRLQVAPKHSASRTDTDTGRMSEIVPFLNKPQPGGPFEICRDWQAINMLNPRPGQRNAALCLFKPRTVWNINQAQRKGMFLQIKRYGLLHFHCNNMSNWTLRLHPY